MPYLDENALFDEFHLDEPWDSPHNLPRVRQMPKVYALPGDGFAADAAEGRTYYKAFVGTGAAFEPGERFAKAAFTDGPASTMMLAEGTKPTPWTKPDGELVWNGIRVPDFGPRDDSTPLVVLADGTVRSLDRGLKLVAMGGVGSGKAAITRNAGDVVGPLFHDVP